MDPGRRRSWIEALPALLPIALLLVAAMLVVQGSYRARDGHLVYPTDDAYIQMAMARNLTEHGVFGVTRYGFSSTTSSPLWTLLLAGSFRLAGVRDWIPGIWSLAAAAALLLAVDRFGRRFELAAGSRLAAGLLVLYLTPLVPLALLGMEHALHAALLAWLLLAVTTVGEKPSRGELIPVCLLAFLATAVRYESLFLLLPLAVVLTLRRRRLAAGLLMVSGSVAPAIYGAVSLAGGSYLLPNSLMLKGRFYPILGPRSLLGLLGYHGARRLLGVPHLLGLGALLLSILLLGRRKVAAPRWLSAALLAAVLLHLQYADIGWFYRYEGYLVALGILLACVAWLPRVASREQGARGRGGARRALVVAALALPALWPLHLRARAALEDLLPASRNIYEQQFQMGTLLAEELEPGARVALNDLGAAAYLADVHVLDLGGLASLEVTRAKRAGRFDSARIAELLSAHRIDYILVYPEWFRDETALPSTVIPVGTWTIADNVVCGAATVAFYGTSVESARRLSAALDRHETRLPRTVRCRRVRLADP